MIFLRPPFSAANRVAVVGAEAKSCVEGCNLVDIYPVKAVLGDKAGEESYRLSFHLLRRMTEGKEISVGKPRLVGYLKAFRKNYRVGGRLLSKALSFLSQRCTFT